MPNPRQTHQTSSSMAAEHTFSKVKRWKDEADILAQLEREYVPEEEVKYSRKKYIRSDSASDIFLISV
jgi:hypothetical protein